jgi:hypothetical protein
MKKPTVILIAAILAGCGTSTPLASSHGYLADDDGRTGTWVWQGTTPSHRENVYRSHGDGTFNVNPAGGADGFWIGERRLGDMFRGILTAETATNAARSVLYSTSRYVWDGDVCWRRGIEPGGFIYFEAVTNIDVTAVGNEEALEALERSRR